MPSCKERIGGVFVPSFDASFPGGAVRGTSALLSAILACDELQYRARIAEAFIAGQKIRNSDV